jgi:exodeoxyribonuclease V beta subunit
MLQRLVEDVTATPLPTTSAAMTPATGPADKLRLASIPLSRRLTELEFNLPVPHLAAGALNTLLKKNGYDVPALSFGALEGYLKGFIDLVFEHEGRFFILDWKSNHLGYSPSDYGPEPIERSMADHGYHLQYLLYTLAVDRYLRLRVPEYQYETHFGGVLYLFVRGVRPDWAAADATPGVFFHRPDIGTIRELNHLLGAVNTP